jgi:hypothetical protein
VENGLGSEKVNPTDDWIMIRVNPPRIIKTVHYVYPRKGDSNTLARRRDAWHGTVGIVLGPGLCGLPRMAALGNTVNKGERGLAAYNHRRTEDL